LTKSDRLGSSKTPSGFTTKADIHKRQPSNLTEVSADPEREFMFVIVLDLRRLQRKGPNNQGPFPGIGMVSLGLGVKKQTEIPHKPRIPLLMELLIPRLRSKRFRF
jgi:hypothetical protein